MEIVLILVVVVIIIALYSFFVKNSKNPKSDTIANSFEAFADKYSSYEEIQDALRTAGLESSNLILAIDYTKSNESTGFYSFGNKCLHYISPTELNPYQRVIQILGRTLEPFDDDKLIPTFGFGDIHTKNKSCFAFFPDRVPYTFQEVLARYTEITPNVALSGPTSFAPVIYEAINIVKRSGDYHILVIIADGVVTNVRATKEAIVTASKYPLSIVMVGVGDGPFDLMEEFDDNLPERTFDNFQFVNFTRIMKSSNSRNPELEFATRALMEIPDQFMAIKKLELI